MISRMFKTIGNQRFEYKPRHYDPNKEALRERLELKARVKAGDKTAIKQQMRNSMRRAKNKQMRSDYVVKSNVTIMAIFAILLILAVIALNVYLPQFLEVVLSK